MTPSSQYLLLENKVVVFSNRPLSCFTVFTWAPVARCCEKKVAKGLNVFPTIHSGAQRAEGEVVNGQVCSSTLHAGPMVCHASLCYSMVVRWYAAATQPVHASFFCVEHLGICASSLSSCSFTVLLCQAYVPDIYRSSCSDWIKAFPAALWLTLVYQKYCLECYIW